MAILYRNKITEEDLSYLALNFSNFEFLTDVAEKREALASIILNKLKLYSIYGYSWNIVNQDAFDCKFLDFIYKYNQIIFDFSTADNKGFKVKHFSTPVDTYDETRSYEKTSDRENAYTTNSTSSSRGDSDDKSIQEESPIQNTELFDVASPSLKENNVSNFSNENTGRISSSGTTGIEEGYKEELSRDKTYFENYYKAYNYMMKNPNIEYLITKFVKSLVYEVSAIW